jgi:hypothetical protein
MDSDKATVEEVICGFCIFREGHGVPQRKSAPRVATRRSEEMGARGRHCRNLLGQ